MTKSAGARRYYDQLRARGKTHRQSTRQLANGWVEIQDEIPRGLSKGSS